MYFDILLHYKTKGHPPPLHPVGSPHVGQYIMKATCMHGRVESGSFAAVSQGQRASRGSPTLAVLAFKAVAIGTPRNALLVGTGFVSGEFGQWRSLQEWSNQTPRWAGHLARQL